MNIEERRWRLELRNQFGPAVWFLQSSAWLPVPRFHRTKDHRGEDRLATSCGRTLQRWEREQGQVYTYGFVLPVYHAITFGHPCNICFPDAKDWDGGQ